MKEAFKQYINDLFTDTSIEDAFYDEEIFDYIRKNYEPEDIFDEVQLRGWADKFYSQ